MKDGTNTDMLRGAVSKLWSGDFRMGKPTVRNGTGFISEYIGYKRQTRGTETSKYPEEEKANAISWVAASETESAQTKRLASWGCRTLYTELQRNEVNEEVWKGPSKKVTTL
jgi:hypothetical protein